MQYGCQVKDRKNMIVQNKSETKNLSKLRNCELKKKNYHWL